MTPELRTERSVRESEGVRERVADWVLLNGDRRVVAGALVAAVAGVVWTLVAAGVLAVGPKSYVASIFGAGLTAGVVTLLTIALSINQLVLSRVFGSVNVLQDRLAGSRDLRRTVESIAGVPSSPNDPAEFLSLIATTLAERAGGLAAAGDGNSEREGGGKFGSDGNSDGNADDWNLPATATDALRDIAAYGESLDGRLESSAGLNAVVGVLLGTEYARNMTAASHLRNEYASSVPPRLDAEFEAIEGLLESIAVVRQFYKTMAIQQDLATLSRLLVYSGLSALMAAVVVTLIYRTKSTTVPTAMLPVVVSAGIGVIVAPLALFVAYILRAATVARQTVSVGPFTPPRNQQ